MLKVISSKSVSLDLDFKFLGHRDYVHGSSMLEGMLNSTKLFLQSEIPIQAKIKVFKIIREFDTNAVSETMLTKDCHYHPGLKDAAARLDLEIDDHKISSILMPKPELPVLERLSEYDAADYVKEIDILPDGTSYGKLRNLKNLIDLLRGIVEANRQISLKEPDIKHNMIKMRWGYITDFNMLSIDDILKINTVSFSSSTYLPFKDRWFSVKQARFDSLASPFDFEICFFVKKSSG